MKRILIATRNAHKVQEILAILGNGLEYLTLNEFPDAPVVVEDAPTFAGNATKKAVELARWLSEKWAAKNVAFPDLILADDSGLEVDALNGAPGVHSARFAALDSGASGNSSDQENRSKLLRLLANVPPERRTARFRCVVALAPMLNPEAQSASPVCYADEFELQTQVAHGACEGRIILEEKGRGGFGYDSLFVPDGYTQTFAELSESEKNRMSHRARALEGLKSACR